MACLSMLINMIAEIILVIFVSYTLGSIPSGIIFTKIFRLKDIRTIGSGNTVPQTY